MSRLLDFKELRDRILAGEEDEEITEEPQETPFKQELKSKMTALPLCISAASFAIVGFDKWQNDGQMFKHYTPLIFIVGGILPLGFALGRLNRGSEAQVDETRYEKLLDEAQTALEESEEEKEAEQAAEDVKNDYRMDYLSADTAATHIPTIGFGMTGVGQEGVVYRPSSKRHDSLW